MAGVGMGTSAAGRNSRGRDWIDERIVTRKVMDGKLQRPVVVVQ
jgi:hypothetical protein